MKITEFVENFKNAKVQNTRVNPDAVGEWVRKNLEIKTYIPFREKREIAEMIVGQNISVVDGIKKYDSIDGYVSLIIASIAAHTTLEFSNDPVADYDLLAESSLMPQIIAEFQDSHEEIGILLKMAIAAELEDNNMNVIIGNFLDGILNKFRELDLNKLFGANISEENLTKLIGLIDKIK